MKYGIILAGETIADQIAAAKLADSRGFYSVWTTEFFHQHGFVRLGAVAAAKQNVKVGTAIAYAFMRTPMLAASAAMDVDEISNGRVILGLGSGTRSMNEKWYSMPFDRAPAPRMRDAIGLIRAAIERRVVVGFVTKAKATTSRSRNSHGPRLHVPKSRSTSPRSIAG